MSVIEGEALISEAAETLRNQARDFYKLKITLPLGDKNLKYVHTNQFIWLELDDDVFPLANWKYIAEALDGYETQHSGYVKNRWYIESCTITNDGNSAKMELELNPFASSTVNLTKDYESFTEAYDQAYNKNNNNNTNSIPSVASDNTTATGGEGKEIDDLVKSIIKDKTDVYEKAKAIHEYLVKHWNYSRYLNSRTNSPTQALHKWQKGGINCADTAKLTASMFRSAGVPCFVVHIPKKCPKRLGHYFTIFTYNNVRHCSDATGTNPLDKYWTDCGKKKYNGGKVWDRTEGDGLNILH